MKSTLVAENISGLIPNLTEKDMSEMRAYHIVYTKYLDEFSERGQRELKEHPVFGPLIMSIPEDVAKARSEISRKLQENAILHGDWEPYVDNLIDQGMMYAKMGLEFKAWYEIVAMVRNYVTPYLYKEYGSGDKFISAVNGMNTFVDIGMSVIGEAYIRHKNDIIEEFNNSLELKIAERTEQLEAVNNELEAFTYSVSHDLRAPLRAINGYAEMLKEDYGEAMGSDEKRILGTISYNAAKMGMLIDDLLTFTRLGRKELNSTRIIMQDMVEGVLVDIEKSMNHKTHIKIGKLHNVTADYNLINQVWYNLISNAIKYSSKKKNPVVEIKSEETKNEIIYSIKDNGAGFDMKYVDKLFGVFQRLHSQEEFEGTGVGLAIVHRLVSKHEGRVWAESKVGSGAVFYFALNK